jgi:16S rRNA (cytosine1402-N4)-methyltransferase
METQPLFWPPYHQPALRDEVLRLALETKSLRVFIDATVGDGSHLEALLSVIPQNSRILAFDQDLQALERARMRLKAHLRFLDIVWEYARFSSIPKVLDELGLFNASFILLDLGVSSLQLDTATRGFSFSKAGPLDMRMDPSVGQPVSFLVNRLSEKELASILWDFGQELQARRIAKAIIDARKAQFIDSTTTLAGIIQKAVGYRAGFKRIHPATRSFMALRIAVNDELEELKKGLEGAVSRLQPCGRMVVISYHSLEDGLVKRFFRSRNDGVVLTKKPIRPSREEVHSNPRSRSAKLRCFEKMGDCHDPI